MDSPEARPAQPNTPLPIRYAPGVRLSAAEMALLQRAFAGSPSLFIEREFRSGYSGAVVLLVSPGGGQAQLVVKLGPPGDVQREYRAYHRFVAKTAPQNTARLQGEPLLSEDKPLALLRYTFAGGDPRLPTRSLQAYYDSQGGPATAAVLDRIFRIYGRQWWANHRPQKSTLAEQYSRLLPVHVKLKKTSEVSALGRSVTGPTPGHGPGGSAAEESAKVWLDLTAGQTSAASLRDLHPGQRVRLHHFRVDEIRSEKNEVTLTAGPPPGEASAPLRLRLETDETAAYHLDQRVEHLETVVTVTRSMLLAEAARAALPTFDPDAPQLHLAGRAYPNPLRDLNALLDRVIELKTSIIHGDLNLQNILVDEATGFAWLIDFAETRHGPTLYDLQRLETQVLTKLLPPALDRAGLDETAVADLLEALHTDPPPATAPQAALQDPYTVLVTLRRLARQYLMDDRDWDEYYLGLLVVLLGSLKFADLQPVGHRVALVAAAVARSLLGRPPSLLTQVPSPGFPTQLPPVPPTSSPPTIPYQAPDLPLHFVNRTEVNSIATTLLTAEQPLALRGMGGVGKTTIAMAVAHQPQIRRHFKDGILWANLGPNSSIEGWQIVWGDALGLDLQNYPDSRVRATRLRQFLTAKRCLLVIDDVWPETDVRDLLVGGPACRTLLTTRHAGISRKIGAQSINIGVLSEGQDLDLLSAWAERALASEPTAAELVWRLGYLPLAVSLAGAQLLDGAEPAELLAAFQARQGDLTSLDMENAQRKEESLKLTFDLSLQRLTGADRHRFAQLSVFVADEPFEAAAIGAVWQNQTPTQHIRVLVRHALLNRHDSGANQPEGKRPYYTLHPLLRDYAQSWLSASDRTVAAQRHTAYYLSVAQKSNDNWQATEQALGQIRGAWHRVKQDESEQLFKFVAALQTFFDRRGFWQTWLAWTKGGLALAQKLDQRGREAVYLNNLACIQSNLGQWDEALTTWEQALTIDRTLDRKAHMAICLNNIGGFYHNRGDLEQALATYQQALAVNQTLGRQANMAIQLGNIGRIYHNWGDLSQAFNHYRQALIIDQSLHNRPGIAINLNDIGQVYYRWGDWDRALDNYEQALALNQKLGDKTQIAACFNNIGEIFHERGDLEQALAYYEQALALNQEMWHKTGIASALSSIGQIHHDRGDLDQALVCYQQSLTLLQELDHPAGLAAELSHIGQIYQDRGDLEQALTYYQEALTFAQKLGHKMGLAREFSQIGQLYYDRGELDHALNYCEQGLAIDQTTGHKAGVARDLMQIGQIHLAQARWADAEKVLVEAVEIFEQLGSPQANQAQSYLEQAIAGDQGHGFD